MYTNGYKYSDVQAVLVERVGWLEDTNLTLSTANKVTKSERYFNDASFHSLVTVKNIIETMENQEANESGKQAYLQSLTKAAVAKVLTVFSEPQYLQQSTLFERYGRGDMTISNSSQFAGWKFRVANDDEIVMQLPSVRLYFTEDKTFNLYLFQDGIPAPVKTQSVSAKAYEFVDVALTDWYLKKGNYYAGYFQDDLDTSKAIHENVKCYAPGFAYAAQSVFLTPAGAEGINTENEGGGYTNGLNFDVTVFKDFTKKILRNAAQFDNAIGYAMACIVLEKIITTTVSNGTERALKDVIADAAYDLNGTIPVMGIAKKQGLKDKLQEELEKVSKTFFPNPKAQTVSLC